MSVTAFSQEDLLEDTNQFMSQQGPRYRIKWLFQTFPDQIVILSSLGPNTAVLLHLIATSKHNPPIVYVNPGNLPKTNIQYLEALMGHFPSLDFKDEKHPDFFSKHERDLVLARGGEEELQRTYDKRKLKTIDRMVSARDLRVLVSGARHAQDESRPDQFLAFRKSDECLQAYPIYDWSDKNMASYINRHGLPIHPEGLPGKRPHQCDLHRRGVTLQAM